MKFHGSIEKTFKDDQGHLIVCGHASTEALDSQGEIVTKEAMAAALTDYMKFANVREMHQPSAVGKTMVAEQDAKGTYIEVKVVDPVAAMKCEEGVYSGFSIGGKASSRDPMAKNTITGLRLTEISLVDRPANPEAVFTMFKLDDELDEDVDKVAYADPADKKYPIDTEEHIRAAWSYINMPKNADKVSNVKEIKARIIAAWKKKIDPKGPPSAEKGDTAMDIKKGMCHVAQLAMELKEIGYMVNDQADEAAREGDDSPIPAKLQAWLQAGAVILNEMTAEETAELVAAAGQNLVPETIADEVVAEFQQADAATQNAIQMADGIDPKVLDLAKKFQRRTKGWTKEHTEHFINVWDAEDSANSMEKLGAKFSQETKDKLINIMNTISENLGNIKSLVFPDITTDLTPIADGIANPDVYAQPEGERGTAGTPVGFPDTSPNAEMAKPVADPAGVHAAGKKGEPIKAEEPEDIKKSYDETLAKVASLTTDLEKASSTIDTLTKRVAELEKEPAPSKVRLVSIEKGQDVVTSDPVAKAADELKKSKNPVDVMKGVLMTGAKRGFPL